jgi:hypothetical protein
MVFIQLNEFNSLKHAKSCLRSLLDLAALITLCNIVMQNILHGLCWRNLQGGSAVDW